MPKLKTNRAARKRFQRTAKGHFKRGKAFLRHILTSKAPKRKRKLRVSTLVHPADERVLRRLLPYG